MSVLTALHIQNQYVTNKYLYASKTNLTKLNKWIWMWSTPTPTECQCSSYILV